MLRRARDARRRASSGSRRWCSMRRIISRLIPCRIKVQLHRAYNYLSYNAGVLAAGRDPLLPPYWLHCVGEGDYTWSGAEFFRYFVEVLAGITAPLSAWKPVALSLWIRALYKYTSPVRRVPCQPSVRALVWAMHSRPAHRWVRRHRRHHLFNGLWPPPCSLPCSPCRALELAEVGCLYDRPALSCRLADHPVRL